VIKKERGREREKERGRERERERGRETLWYPDQISQTLPRERE